MAKTVTITNGTGTTNLINGAYSVTASVTGYDNTSINPNSVTIEEGTNTYAFTISATGTLTLHVTEDGTASGTPVVGAVFVRTDSTGTEYGTPVTSDAEGNAVFNNVPFDETSAPTIYFKQTASDGEHEFDSSVQSTTMTTSTSTLEIQNTLGALRTINLTDANYENLPIDGSMTFTN
ncbi:MAG: hypothetical protein J5970_02510 [Bacilli bacterium]|nr:hypothetical protein [Bacilli bacterium]